MDRAGCRLDRGIASGGRRAADSNGSFVSLSQEVETVFELMICEDDRTIPFKVPPQSYLSTFGVTGADSQPVKEEEEEKDGQG